MVALDEVLLVSCKPLGRGLIVVCLERHYLVVVVSLIHGESVRIAHGVRVEDSARICSMNEVIVCKHHLGLHLRREHCL